jgi:hypothetical protein
LSVIAGNNDKSAAMMANEKVIKRAKANELSKFQNKKSTSMNSEFCGLQTTTKTRMMMVAISEAVLFMLVLSQLHNSHIDASIIQSQLGI